MGKGRKLKLVATFVDTGNALRERVIAAAFRELGYPAVIAPYRMNPDTAVQHLGLNGTLHGARCCARRAEQVQAVADLYIGVENGLIHQDDQWFDLPCVVVRSREGRESFAFGTSSPIPTWVVQKAIDSNGTLDEIVEKLVSNGEKDPAAHFSFGSILREQILSQTLCCALIPLLYPSRYNRP